MKSRILSILIATTIMLSACGSQTTTVDLTQKPTETKSQSIETSETNQTERTEESSALLDKDVDIIISAYDFSNEGIDKIIEDYKSDHPNDIVNKYDDTHYTITIKESERVDTLKEIESSGSIENAFKEIFSDEQYACLKSVEYNDDYTEFTFYSTKEEYENAGLWVTIAPVFLCSILSDSIQAYELVLPEDRHCTVKIIDSDTKEVLYNSDEEQ